VLASNVSASNLTQFGANPTLVTPHLSGGFASLNGNTSGTLFLSWPNVASGTMSLQNGTDTIVARNTTDTLSGKTISGASNTLSNIAFSSLATEAANTVLGNATAGAASPAALAMPSCSTAASALLWTTSGGYSCNTSITANAVPAANLTGATLASGVTASSLTSVGTLVGGATGTGFTLNFGTSTQSGNVLATHGGTGQSAFAVGDLLYADTTTTIAKLADVATGNALISGGVGAAPSWGKIGLTTHVSGTLALGNGGTGQTTKAAAFDALSPMTTAGDVIYGGTAGTGTRLPAGTSSQVLTGGTTPAWGSVPAAAMPALTGSCTTTAGTVATTCEQDGAWPTFNPTVTFANPPAAATQNTSNYLKWGSRSYTVTYIYVVTNATGAATGFYAFALPNGSTSASYGGCSPIINESTGINAGYAYVGTGTTTATLVFGGAPAANTYSTTCTYQSTT
jgi:hypothetical protein